MNHYRVGYNWAEALKQTHPTLSWTAIFPQVDKLRQDHEQNYGSSDGEFNQGAEDAWHGGSTTYGVYARRLDGSYLRDIPAFETMEGKTVARQWLNEHYPMLPLLQNGYVVRQGEAQVKRTETM